MGKRKWGSVVIDAANGRLRLRLPRSLYEGKQKYLTLGLIDTPEHRRIAEAKAKLIEADIALDRFDPSLAKYGKQQPAPAITKPVKAPTYSLAELWDKYAEYRRPQVEETTYLINFKRVEGHIKKLPAQTLDEAIQIRDHLIANASPYTAKRMLVQFSACCEWAQESGLIGAN